MVTLKKSKAEGKRALISQAQQYMIFAVLGATIFLGAAVAVVVKSINQISFSANVIMSQDQSIVSFSDTIKNIGICQKPKGAVYTDEELKKCNPNDIDVSNLTGTLRYDILKNLASNTALESAANRSDAGCINPDTKKKYTYSELEKKYDSAETEEDTSAAIKLIKNCSALRVIPDALPAYENEEALLASVDQIFRLSGTKPNSLSPTDETDMAPYGNNLYTISVRLAIESDTATVQNFLKNVEKSIRNFNVDRLTIDWSSNDTVEIQAQATAFYMTPSTLTVTSNAIKTGAKK